MMMMTTTTKKKNKNIQEEEEPNPGGGGGGGSSTTLPAGPLPAADRISELPKEILHHILGFLEMDEFLIGTSLVSTKWRNLWKSVSVLKFTSCLANGSGRCALKYQNFMDHVLSLRDSEASKIEIFRYYCHDSITTRVGYDLLESLLNLIVSAAVNQGAQEIIIDSSWLRDQRKVMIFQLNPSIFNSGLVRKFTFNIYTTDFLVQFPRSMCCTTQLTHLSLYGIRLPQGDESSNAQLHLVCPVLETLVMNCCNSKHLKVLDISAPRLKTLFICNIGMRNNADFDFLGGCRLEIRTPNLTSLEYSGCVYVDCFTENLPRIADATLLISEETSMMEKTTSFAIKLLKGLSSAESLTLLRFEVFWEDILKELLTPFTSLRTLKLFTSCKISRIHGMVHFLNSCTSVEKLVWNVNEIPRVVESDEHLMLPQCRLSHLKYVHIKRLRGHWNEIEFVKFLLKNSVVLEDIIIQTTANSPKQSIEENLKQFIKEEPSCRKSIKLEIL